jgi:hypothetical protein
VNSWNALERFSGTYNQWQPHLRLNATKTFVVVTDDNSFWPAQFFHDCMAQEPDMFANWKFSGIFCTTHCLDAASVGTVYMELVSHSGGVAGDLCLQDFQPVFDELAKSVIATSKLDCEWEIPPVPDGETFATDKTNVQYTDAQGNRRVIGYVASRQECDTREAWHYDDANNPSKVVVCPETCTEIQRQLNAQIDILFGCETVVLE